MRRSAFFWWLTVATALFALRLLFISTTMTINDEAYYAMYARHLDLGYIDHGPLIAYLIRLSTSVFGENGFGVRFVAVALLAVQTLAVYIFGHRHFSPATGAVLSLTVSVNMLTHTNAVVMTPDAPLACFTVLAILSYYLAFFVDRRHFFVAGPMLGLAMLAKISAFFPGLGIFLFPFLSRDKRGFLKEPRFYVSFLLAAVIFLPFIVWNARHDFAFFRYQGAHIARSGNLGSFFELWGALFVLVGPAAFVYTVAAPVRAWLEARTGNAGWRGYFGLVVAIPLLYFLAQSFASRLEVNWPAPVFFGGLFVFGLAVGEAWRRLRRVFRLQMIFSLLLIIVVTAQVYFPVLPIPHDDDPTARYFQYTAFENDLGSFLDERPALARLRMVANNYQIPSMVNFYEKPGLEAICLSIGYHETLYGFLYPDETLIGDDFLFVAESHEFPGHLRAYFEDVTFEGKIESTRRGSVINTFTLWRVVNYRGKLRNDT